MLRRRLHWRLYIYSLGIVCGSLLALGWFVSDSVWRLELRRAADELEVRARLLLHELPPTLPAIPNDSLTAAVRRMAQESGLRITLVNKTGLVIADTQLPHGSQSVPFTPEIRDALAGKRGTAKRYSSTARMPLFYVAMPISTGDTLSGAIRLSVPVSALREGIDQLNMRMLLVGLVIALAATLIMLEAARRITQPLHEMRSGAEQFAAGNLAYKLTIPEDPDLGRTAHALNHMATQLDEKIRLVTQQRNEQEAILVSLRESVIAVDRSEHILFVNRAAEELLDIDAQKTRGRLLAEVVRISELQHFVSSVMQSKHTSVLGEIQFGAGKTRTLTVSGTRLHDAGGHQMGILLAINDVTQLRRLENVRRDFVANVSHELKTPVTAIKGFVETLTEGALGDPEAAKTFLERIGRNAERLNAIIEDLLALSRIEQEDNQAYLRFPVVPLRGIAESAITGCGAKAAEHGIEIGLQCIDNVSARVNSTLLEQAITNLLDNAIKNSDPGTTIEVEIAGSGDEAVIHVRDHGCGIEAEHLPRLFERFYRVDMARSRKLGGTGLGLAIVKHVAQAHGGRVTVQSKPGIGSTFTIFLPLAKGAEEQTQ